ncbi:MAG: Gfo/Idh/MocA family protein [Chitinophagales bacterium]|jgi:predicted dehydrogenase|nr:Gfo/Idh/MocA family oxidoreductase [Sphingobacteriales bacterium]
MHHIGIVGLGHLGEIHLKQWLEIISREHITCFDADEEKMTLISERYQVEKAKNFDSLLARSTIIDVVTPTDSHHFYAEEALKKGKHVFIEKPVCTSMAEVENLIHWQNKSGAMVQVGHVERYNPAFQVVKASIHQPKFFEVHRLAPFVSRGTEVSVIMDLMIHDLDIILYLVDSPIRDIAAKGVAILSQTPDIANVRLEFENGCVANLTASRISMKKMRKMRVFSDEGYTAIDFLEKSAEIMTISEMGEGIAFTTNEGVDKRLMVKSYDKLDKNAIFEELNDFYNSVTMGKSETAVDLASASKTMSLALRIQELL